VPFATGVASVPFGGEVPIRIERLSAAGIDRIATVPVRVRICVDALKVGDVVVAGVSVDVVDMVSRRDWAIDRFPDFLMQPSDSTLPVCSPGREVLPQRQVPGFRVSPEDDSVELD
jgi:hypothetical protein